MRIGFQLETVAIGLNKWKSLVTGCVVISAEAPTKIISKRLSEIGGAIAEYIRALDKPIQKKDLVKHFKDQYKSSSIYRELKKLVNARQATDSMGVINKVRIGTN